MWEALIKIQKIIQNIRPLRIEYSREKGGFYENQSTKRKLCSLVIDSNIFLIWMASLIGLKLAVTKSYPNKSIQQQVLSMVLQVLFVGIFSLFLTSIWTFKYRGATTVWLTNQAKSFYDKREDEKKNSIVTDDQCCKSKAISLFDFLLYGMVGVCICGVLTVGLMPLLSNHTPANMILNVILPQYTLDHLQSAKHIVTMICCAYLGVFGSLGVIPVLQVFLYMCGILYETQFMLKPTYLIKEHSFFRRYNFSQHKITYMKSYMFVQQYNDFGYAYFPVVMTTGFCVNVVTSLICIQFHSNLHPMLVACFAGFDVICACLTVGIHTFAMISSEESKKFHRYWVTRLFTKFHRKDFQACMPITIEIGPYFMLKRRTLLNTTSEIVKATVSLLIMDQ